MKRTERGQSIKKAKRRVHTYIPVPRAVSWLKILSYTNSTSPTKLLVTIRLGITDVYNL